MAAPKDVMTRNEIRALQDLSCHFSSGEDDSSGGDQGSVAEEVSDGEEVRVSRKRPRQTDAGSPKPSTRHPWQPFLNLESPTIPAEIKLFLSESHGDPTAFLTSELSLAEGMTDVAHARTDDVFLSYYQFTLRLAERQAVDNLRWCFAMLMYYDLAKLLRKDGTGRVGKLMLAEVEIFLELILERQIGIKSEDVWSNLNAWSLCGKKLNYICSKLGHGCLFFIAVLLTKHL